MVQRYDKNPRFANSQRKVLKTRKGVKPIEFHPLSLSLVIVVYRYLLHLLEIGILDIVVLTAVVVRGRR